MKSLGPALLIACSFAGQALADISSVRPMPRPVFDVLTEGQVQSETQIAAAEFGTPALRSIRPMPRPDSLQAPVQAPVRAAVQAAVQAPKRGLLGKLFGPKKAVERKPEAQAAKTYISGSICNDPAIQGTVIPSIRGAQKGCGVENPVRITAVDGVTLSTPATIDCDTARALRKWVTNKVKPAFGRNKVIRLQVAADYACRGRNNKKGARISEHGRGKAIDIAGFTLSDGTELSVLSDYKSNRGKVVRKVHKGACGIFGTTLGPGSDGYHENHLHFDTASYRGGPYCK